MFGLPDETLKLIQEYFTRQTDIEKAVIYGSRAMGTNAAASDIDIAIWTTSTGMAARVKDELENLSTPYLFDVTDYKTIGHPPLKEHIDKVGKILFMR